MHVTPEQERVIAAILAKYGDLFQQCAAHMLDMFKNTSGYDFRDWFIDRHHIEKYRELKNDVTPQAMVDLIQTHTFLKTQIAPPEAALEFFTKFFDEDGQDEEDEQDENVPTGIEGATQQ